MPTDVSLLAQSETLRAFTEPEFKKIVASLP